MNCKFCMGELPEDTLVCPHCGRDNTPEEEAPLTEEENVVVVPEAPQDEQMQPEEDLGSSPKIKRMKRFAAISGCVAGLAVLATILLFGIMGNWKFLDFLKPRENNVQYKDSYTVSDKKAQSKHDVVVATLGDAKLTNGTLQVYYWMQVYDFLDYYGYYASYYGLDYTKPLDEQEFSGGGTWQQYFLEMALENWNSYQALALEADANGFVLDAEYQEILDNLEQTLTEAAQKQNMSSAEELIQSEMGAGCTLADYLEYRRVYYTGYQYFNRFYESLEFTDAELEAYFAEHEKEFKEKSITKDSGKYVDVRHILIKIEELSDKAEGQAEGDGDDGNYGYSQEAWDACLAEAQAILDTWLAGEQTEDSFAALATEKTEDPGSKDSGGLYTGVKVGQMVEPFEDWCFDEVRKVGDYGLVKTKHGYHIMYFSGSEEIWKAETRNAMISDATHQLVEDAAAKYTLDVDYKKIVLAEVSLAG